jgi:ribosome-associated protein
VPIRVNDEVEIPEDALTFTASRSGGPGGQHVNKTSSRVTLRVDLAHGSWLTEPNRERLFRRLGRRIAADGTLRVICQSSRSQLANKRTAIERLAALVADALAPVAPRVATGVPSGSRTERLRDKKRRGDVKRLRRAAEGED